MTRYGKLFALAVLAGLPASSPAAEFSYSYLELMADVSKTENTAAAPLEDDADGRLFGIVGSWEVFDSFYVKGAWSRETKDFRNEVALTPVDLDSKQTVIDLGAGYYFDAGERTNIYAEALAIVDFEVEHRIPDRRSLSNPGRHPYRRQTPPSTVMASAPRSACVTGSAKGWSSKAGSHAPIPARMSFAPAKRSPTPRPCSGSAPSSSR